MHSQHHWLEHMRLQKHNEMMWEVLLWGNRLQLVYASVLQQHAFIVSGLAVTQRSLEPTTFRD